jgi:GGDEF domain-containing protein
MSAIDLPRRVFLLSEDRELARTLAGLWPVEGQIAGPVVSVFARGRSALEAIFEQPPDLLLVDGRLADLPFTEVVALVKGENVYRQLPVVACLTPAAAAALDPAAVEIDDFLLLPIEPAVARARLELTMSRAARSLDANPLSRLPGNTSIISRIQNLIDLRQDFALAYVDLDHFKSFNDAYGFARGDEVLLMTARILANTVRDLGAALSFVGHVGGDDFVCIVPVELAEKACLRIIDSFDRIVPSFYDPADAVRGGLRSTDRQGQLREFPLMAVSIAVVFNLGGSLTHFGQVSAIAAGLKKKAKEKVKSSYVLDRRREGNGQPA